MRTATILLIVIFSFLTSVYGGWKLRFLEASKALAKNQHIIISMADEWHDRQHTINYLTRMKHIGVENILVLCRDRRVFDAVVGSWKSGFKGVLLGDDDSKQAPMKYDVFSSPPNTEALTAIIQEKDMFRLEATRLLLEHNFHVTYSATFCAWMTAEILKWIGHSQPTPYELTILDPPGTGFHSIFDSIFYSAKPTRAVKDVYMSYYHLKTNPFNPNKPSDMNRPVYYHISDSSVINTVTNDKLALRIGVLPSHEFAHNTWCNISNPLLYCYSPTTLRIARDSHMFVVHNKWRKLNTPAEVIEYGNEVKEWNDAGIVSTDHWKCLDFTDKHFLSDVYKVAEQRALRTSDGDKYIIITSGDWVYRGVLINWMASMAKLNVSQYLVLCFGESIHKLVGSHSGGVLITGWGTMNNIFTTRHKVAYALAKQGYIVSLVDSDAVWLKPLYSTWIAPLRGKVDIISQMGSHPLPLANLYGATACAGFLTIFPTQSAMSFYEYYLVEAESHSTSTDEVWDDQKSLNAALADRHAFAFNPRAELVIDKLSPQYGKVLVSSISHGGVSDNSGSVSNGPGEGTSLRLAFLPAAQFPRNPISSDDWTVYVGEHDPVVWHLVTKKAGNDKVYTMQYYEGVCILDADDKWRGLRSAEELEAYLNRVITAPLPTSPADL
jgi:hypothetical protein